MNDFQKYSVEDLMMNESFQLWVMGKAEKKESLFWEHWIEESEENRARAEEAAKVIRLVQFKPQEVEVNLIKNVALLKEKLRKFNHSSPQRRRLIPWPISSWYLKVAAVLAFIILLGSGYWGLMTYLHFKTEQIVKTDYGEKIRLTLADGSTVILNGHSSLTYFKRWAKGKERKVTLEGEAYFSVTKKAEPFRVYTSDGIITVLGTEFNVTKWGKRTRVVLNRGKVEITVRKKGGDTKKRIILHPNQMAQFGSELDSIRVECVNSEVYASWRTNMLIFDNTPVREILERMEYTYGIVFIVEDMNVLNKRVSGKIENNKDILLRALANLLKRPVYVQDGKVYIK